MKLKISISILLLAVLTGCTDKKAATDSNFETALNHFVAHERRCIALEDSTFLTKPQPADAGLDLLVTAGMFTKTAAANDASGRPLFQYALTSKGKATRTEFVAMNGQPRVGYLCSGRLVIDKIYSFTEPADNQGVHQSQVTYATKLVDIPSWAQDPAFQKQYQFFEPVATRVAQGAKERQTMVLTSEGWKVQGDL